MKFYLADTNIFVRYFTEKNTAFAKRAREYFFQAKRGKIKVEITSEIILEIEYVLRKVYKLSRDLIAEKLSSLIKTPFFEIKNRNLWMEALIVYGNTKFDLVDIYLSRQAIERGVEILSFDKDFQKLARIE